MDFLVKVGEHVASILKITNESRGVGGENVAGVLAAEGKDFLDFAVVLSVLIDHGTADGTAFALDAGELLDRRGLGEVVQVFVVFDVQLVKNVHGVVFLSVVGCWLLQLAELLYINVTENASIFFRDIEQKFPILGGNAKGVCGILNDDVGRNGQDMPVYFNMILLGTVIVY